MEPRQTQRVIAGRSDLGARANRDDFKLRRFRRSSTRFREVGRYPWSMTTREKVRRLLDELPDSEVEPVLEFIVSHRKGGGKPASRRRPRLGLGRSTDGLSAADIANEPVAHPPA